MIHLFGIRYADIIKQSKISATKIIESTKLKNGKKMSETYPTEINKGVRLAKYVKEK
jgi:hypothetical protein